MDIRELASAADWLHPDELAQVAGILKTAVARRDAARAAMMEEWAALLAGGGARFGTTHRPLALERVTKTQVVLRYEPGHRSKGGEVRVGVDDGRRIGAVSYYGGAPRVALTHLGPVMRAKLLAAMDARGAKVDRVWRGMVESAPESPEVTP